MAVETPDDCMTCRNRRIEEYGPALAAGIRVDVCRTFVSSKSGPLPCREAHGEFCGGSGYEPTLISRLIRLFAA